ncbi:MAG: WecB/TagA/CpsF family glycosyltransferase [Anaerolineales bacterium]|nr:WecB/TagA/CpsF family glycosyltransferase [Anaerolineales bacterium]
MPKVDILGVHVDQVSLGDVLAMIQNTIASNQRALITHVNIRGVHIACENEWFRGFLNASDVVYCDGMGVKLGAKLLGYTLPERFTLADWIWQLADLAEKNNFSSFLLGNPPGAAEKAAARLRERFPSLRIQGVQHGYFDQSAGQAENQAVLERINAVKPDILLVGFGMPLQEKWLQENWERLDIHIAITVGALFEYVAGDLKRGPGWMTQHYMEWLFRLVSSPGRYGKRYLLENPLFFYRILRERFGGK